MTVGGKWVGSARELSCKRTIDKRLIHPYIHVSRGIFLFFFTSSCLPIYFILFLYLSSHDVLRFFNDMRAHHKDVDVAVLKGIPCVTRGRNNRLTAQVEGCV